MCGAWSRKELAKAREWLVFLFLSYQVEVQVTTPETGQWRHRDIIVILVLHGCHQTRPSLPLLICTTHLSQMLSLKGIASPVIARCRCCLDSDKRPCLVCISMQGRQNQPALVSRVLKGTRATMGPVSAHTSSIQVSQKQLHVQWSRARIRTLQIWK